MEEKKVWDIVHEFDMPDGDWYGCFRDSHHVATVLATDREIKDFLEKWDKPEIFGHCTLDGDMEEHHIIAMESKPLPIEELNTPEEIYI